MILRSALWTFLTGAALLLGGLSVPAGAGSVSTYPVGQTKTTALVFSGEVTAGDYERVKAAVERVPNGHRRVLILESPGGSLAEGMLIGRYIHKVQVPTAVVLGPGCHSACALMFLAGRDEKSNASQRIMVVGAKLGFHQGSYRPQGGTYTSEQLAQFERATQDSVARIGSYLSDIKADPEFLTISLSASHNSIKLLSEFEALRLGIYVMNPTTDKLMTPEQFGRVSR